MGGGVWEGEFILFSLVVRQVMKQEVVYHSYQDVTSVEEFYSVLCPVCCHHSVVMITFLFLDHVILSQGLITTKPQNLPTVCVDEDTMKTTGNH